MSTYPRYTVHSRQYTSPMRTIDTIRPHEIAEEEEKELTDWGVIEEKDTSLDDAEPSK